MKITATFFAINIAFITIVSSPAYAVDKYRPILGDEAPTRDQQNVDVLTSINFCAYDEDSGVDASSVFVTFFDGYESVDYSSDLTPYSIVTSPNDPSCTSGSDGANPFGMAIQVHPLSAFDYETSVQVDYRVIDNNGNIRWATMVFYTAAQSYPDGDLDGYSTDGSHTPIDCDDSDPTINPGKLELCSNGIDDDCDGLVDEMDPSAIDCPVACPDTDGDGIDDCNDNCPAIPNPNQADGDYDQLGDACDEHTSPLGESIPPTLNNAAPNAGQQNVNVLTAFEFCAYDGQTGVDASSVFVTFFDGYESVDYSSDLTPYSIVTSPNDPSCTSGSDGANPFGMAIQVHPLSAFDYETSVQVDYRVIDNNGNIRWATMVFYTAAQSYPDGDLDGYSTDGSHTPIDCDDSDPTINPGKLELCSNGIDDDCDGLVDEMDPSAIDCPVACPDTDGDGIDDCNDNCPAIPNPNQADGDYDQLGDACDEHTSPLGESIPPTLNNAAPNAGQQNVNVLTAFEFCAYDGQTGVDASSVFVTFFDGYESVDYSSDLTPYSIVTSPNDPSCTSGSDGANPFGMAIQVHPLSAFDYETSVQVDYRVIDNNGNIRWATMVFYTAAQSYPDGDLDGYSTDGSHTPIDCDDSDPTINPGKLELCSNGIDDDCDGLVDEMDPSAIDCPVACPDTDGDGIDDCNDNCPAIPNPEQMDIDTDDAGDICDDDDDNDGINDGSDNCPLISNPDQVDEDFDYVGDACDAHFNTGTVVDIVDEQTAEVVDILVEINLPGGNGMIAKITGNGGLLSKVGDAVENFELGNIDSTTYVALLNQALGKLDDFDQQLDAKIRNGQIVEPEATLLLNFSPEVRAVINALIANAS